MVEIGIILPESFQKNYKARQLILDLARDFGFSDIQATQWATYFSELLIFNIDDYVEMPVSVIIEENEGTPSLCFDIVGSDRFKNLSAMESFFDKIITGESKDVPSVKLTKKIPDPEILRKRNLYGIWRQRFSEPTKEALYWKFQDKNRELELSREEAVSATKAEGDFLANMSHEIRTPMNAIIGLNSLLAKTDLSSEQNDYVNKINLSANSLLGIINDILDFSKIEAGKMDIEKTSFQLNDVMENLSNLISEKAAGKELELIFRYDNSIPYTLIGDPLRLGQILLNLTNNAVKFTESGEIVVSAELMESTDMEVLIQFRVSDTGIGADP